MKNTLVIFLFIIVLIAIAILGGLYVSKQQTKKKVQSQSEQFLTITNSGSTNFAGYVIRINKDGSGLLQYMSRPSDANSNKSKIFPAKTFSINQMTSTLNQIKDVTTIPIKSDCVKSASFGSKTTIMYKGKTSGDTSCMTDNASSTYQTLQSQITQIQQQALR